jgi:hypothetical protein
MSRGMNRDEVMNTEHAFDNKSDNDTYVALCVQQIMPLQLPGFGVCRSQDFSIIDFKFPVCLNLY